jgi:hypothetical protein
MLGNFATLLIIGGAFAVICLIPWGVVAFIAYRRRVRFERAGEALGLEFSARARVLPGEPLNRLPVFWYGTRRRIRNVLYGRIEDLDAWVFDHQYMCDYGTIGLEEDSSRIHAQTVALMRLPRELPDFELRPRKLFRKRARVRKGYKRVDFAGCGSFAEMYLVRGPDAEQIRAMVDESLIGLLEESGGLCLDGAGQWLAVYRLQKRLKPEEIAQLLEEALDVCGVLA